MKVKLVFILLMLSSEFFLKAQNLDFGLQTGCGFYDMNSLSEITNKALLQLPFEAKIMSNYPPFIYYQPMIVLKGKHTDFSLVYTYQSTGSRISYKDYSGEYCLDSRIFSHSPGFLFSGIMEDFGPVRLSWTIQMGINFTTLTRHEYLQLSSSESSSESKYKARSYYAEPGIKFSVPVNKLSLAIGLGYFKELLRSEYNDKAGRNTFGVKTQFRDSDVWDGFRLGLTLSCPFSVLKKKSSEE